MGGQVDWQAFRSCDVLVEQAIAAGAYREALDHLVQGYQRVILSYCRKQLGSLGNGGRAEEIAQEVFVTAYRVMPRKGQAPVRPWLFAIARKRYLRERRDALRRGRLMQEHQDTMRETSHRGCPTAPAEAELDHLRRSLDRLRKRDRQLIMQRFLEGETVERLAQEYHRAESTIRKRLDKALERLQAIYQQLTQES